MTGKRRPGRAKGTSAKRIFESVRQSILKLEMAPGSDIEEAALVKKFGTSRTPVREALIGLANAGYIVQHSNRGARVASLEFNELPQLLEGLDLCLHVTARWAAIRRTESHLASMRKYSDEFAAASRVNDVDGISDSNNQFHLAVTEAAQNRHLTIMHESLLPGWLRLTHALTAASPLEGEDYDEYRKRTVNEHEALIEAIERQDPDAAANVATSHSELSRDRVSRYLKTTMAAKTPVKNPMALDEFLPVLPTSVDRPLKEAERA